jgi:hypothetical protein
MVNINTSKQNTETESLLKSENERITGTINPSVQSQWSIERIYTAETYCKLDRDEDLFSWFNDQRQKR